VADKKAGQWSCSMTCLLDALRGRSGPGRRCMGVEKTNDRFVGLEGRRVMRWLMLDRD
jgi:hypothetical protein